MNALDWPSFVAWAATQPLDVALQAARVWLSAQERRYPAGNP